MTTKLADGTTPVFPHTRHSVGALSSNFSNFLNLLLTQLRNQNPTSPLDASQFISELVQFSGVEP